MRRTRTGWTSAQAVSNRHLGVLMPCVWTALHSIMQDIETPESDYTTACEASERCSRRAAL
jgi:hypothetical protein